MRILSLGTALVLAAGGVACGATLWPTTSVKTKAYTPDLYGCAAGSARSLKYSLVSHDSTGGRFEARRQYKLSGEGPDVSEYRREDVLTVQIKQPRNDSSATATLNIQAGTLSTQETKRGPTEVVEYASDAAKRDAQTIITRCAST